MPQKRERDGSIRMADDVDSSSILIVRTLFHLFVLDIKGKDPVLLKTIDFLEDRVPLSMGVMKLDKMFMFGGEMGVKDYLPGTDRFLIIDDEKVGSVTDVYKLNPCNWSLEITTEVQKPKYPKINPTVGYVHDKIVVLQGPSFLTSLNTYSRCEVYNPTTNTWNLLPDIPEVFSQFNPIVGRRYFPEFFFVGCRIYIKFGVDELILCFNCDTKEWETGNASNLRDSLEKFSLCFPSVALCVYDGNNGNIIIDCQRESITAFFIHNSGSILCYQQLEGYLCYGIIGNYNRGLSLTDLKSDDGRMCSILLEPNIDESCSSCVYTIHIRHFKLKVKKWPDAVAAADDYDDGGGLYLESTGFLEVEIIEDQCYPLPDSIEKYGLVTLSDAFFL